MRRVVALVLLVTAVILVPEWHLATAHGAEIRGRRSREAGRRSGARPTAVLRTVSRNCDPASAPDRISPSVDPATIHLLNRAAFGPTPHLVWEVECLGRDAWVDQQLFPNLITDPQLTQRLSIYPTLVMTTAQLIENYPQPMPGEEVDRTKTPAQVLAELRSSVVLRAVHSRKQLEEVLVDFWFNHFNVFAGDGPARWATTSYLRDVIRPNVFGHFEDLVLATAESPSMLYYLDNYLNVRAGSRGRNSGLNENYARELLELHTVGVDGGYDQDDIIEVAKAFTGWTIRDPRANDSGFVYNQFFHDDSADSVMGHEIATSGVQQGREIIAFLSAHPATADFIATKLVSRLVADDPPAHLVRRVREVFTQTHGDLRAVVEIILKSEEFYDPVHRLAKVKSPLEIVASSMRAIDAEVQLGLGAARLVGILGQPLLLASPPTGWEEDADAVTSVGGMLTRFEAAFRIATNDIPGVFVDFDRWSFIDAGSLGADRILVDVLQDRAGADTRRAMRRAEREGASSALLGAMALGCPEFQLQ